MRNYLLPCAILLAASSCGAVAAELNATLSKTSVVAYEKVEVSFDDALKVDNPADPRQADVWGVFTAPSGRIVRVPGFFYQPFERSDDAITPIGKATWRVRFTPTEVGKWTASVEAAANGKTLKSKAGVFEITAPTSAPRGFLRRAKANSLALEFENGEPLIAIGPNVFPKTKLKQPVGVSRATDVIRYLEGTAEAGGNFARLRMDSWFIPLELPKDEASGYEGAGRYQPQACWEVDQIVDAAERLGVTLMLCISNTNANVDARPDDYRHRYNMYHKDNGGVLESNEDFWTHPEVRRLFAQKIRYSVARWGASPAIGFWEFFNEVKLSDEKIDEIVDWHVGLSREWRALDPYDRPIATSPVGGFADTDYWWKLFDTPEIDLVQYHTYRYEDLAWGIGESNLGIVARADRPLIVGEYGSSKALRVSLGGTASDPNLDPAGVHLHNGMWASVMTGGAGASPWFIQNYIDTLGLYTSFTGLSRFCADWKINEGPWRPAKVQVGAYPQSLGDQRWGELNLRTRERLAMREQDVYKVLRNGSIAGGGAVDGFLFGLAAHKNYRKPPTFEVDYPAAGKFIVNVKYIVGKSDKPTPVVVYLNDKEIARREFVLGEGQGESATHIEQYDNWNVVFDEAIAIDVPKGKSRIRVESVGTDRVSATYTLTPYADLSLSTYRVYAMGLGDERRLWIQNVKNNHGDLYRKQGPMRAPDGAVRIPVERDGTYTVVWWNTYRGVITRRVVAESFGGALTVDFKGTLTDTAVVVRRVH